MSLPAPPGVVPGRSNDHLQSSSAPTAEAATPACATLGQATKPTTLSRAAVSSSTVPCPAVPGLAGAHGTASLAAAAAAHAFAAAAAAHAFAAAAAAAAKHGLLGYGH